MASTFDDERPLPPGIITTGYNDDEEIGLLKSGKEADVFLLRRHGTDGSTCFLAAKRYRPADQRAFRNDITYRAHRRIDGLVRDGTRRRRPKAGRGVQKAMDQRTDYGKKVLANQWIAAEWEALNTLWTAGAPVPYPIARVDDGLVMQFIGDEEFAAPRLVDARLGREALAGLFEQVRDAMLTFTRAGLVHADLSPYNTLVWDEQVWIIDLPQAVPFLSNDAATDLLHHDVTTICDWFTRKGLDVDAEDLFVELVNVAFDYRMRDLFEADG